MKKIIAILITFLFCYSNSVASNYSYIYGDKKNKEVTHYKCSILENFQKKAKNAEFGIIMGEGMDDYHYVISYSKDKKKYSYPYSYAKYFKRKIKGDMFDIKVFVSLGTPEYRKALGPGFALNFVLYSWVYGKKHILGTYWFNADDDSEGKYLLQEWEDLVKNETQNLDKKLRLFTDKIFNIIAKRASVNTVDEIVDIFIKDQIDHAQYGILDVSSQKCKVKYQKRTTRKKVIDEKSNDEKLLIADQKKKIEEEKRKIEEEKRKIAEAKKKQEKEEKKSKEIKIVSENKDNNPPKIIIANTITVNSSTYEIEGKILDESNKLFVIIDGETIKAENGKFKVKRFSPIDEKINIVGIDQWGNKSQPKIVNIKIKVDETLVTEKLEPLNPSNIKIQPSNNKVALIIGIENYSETPQASFANLDAKFFYEYSKKVFGVKPSNINLLIDEDATVVKTDKALSLWLKSKIKKNRSDLIIFFAGHGLASADGKELYLLPQDGNPDRLERTALSRTDLFREIIELNPKSVTMFLDTCYSGVSRDEQMLLASARPIRILADDQNNIPKNFTIFSASQLDQISSGLKDAEHGIFSYFLMKGLEGNADQNDDRKITNGELLAYMDDNISQKASELGRQQNPSLAGDPNKVLSTY